MGQPNDGAMHLGKGVDVFEYELHSPPLQNRVIDTTGIITPTPLSATEVTETYGSSFAEFVKKFAVKAGLKGSYGGFSGSVESKISRSSTQSTTTKFMSLSTIVSGQMLSIGEDKTVLKQHLDPNFRRAIENDDPQDVFAAYGTHVVVKANIGGLAEFVCHSKESTEITESEFELSVKAKYKTLGASVEGSTELTSSEKSALKNVGGSSQLEVRGGGPAAQQLLRSGKLDAWASWSSSVVTEPAFLGFPKGGLVPIWELVDDVERRQALEAGFKRLAAKNFTVRTFSYTGPSSNRPDARVVIPEDYKLLSGGALDHWSGYGNLLTASFPEGNNTWRALGKDHTEGSAATITVYALAVYDPEDIWDVHVFESTSPSAGHPSTAVSPNGDYKLVGGGAHVHWTGYGNLLTASFPKDQTTWAVSSKDHTSGSPATVTAYAIGLRSKLDGVAVNTSVQKSTSPNVAHPSAEVAPASDAVLVGGGAVVNWSGYGNLLTASYPEDSKTWAASSKDHTSSSPATITSHAIGVEVIVQ